jgi:hypothetical protein
MKHHIAGHVSHYSCGWQEKFPPLSLARDAKTYSPLSLFLQFKTMVGMDPDLTKTPKDFGSCQAREPAMESLVWNTHVRKGRGRDSVGAPGGIPDSKFPKPRRETRGQEHGFGSTRDCTIEPFSNTILLGGIRDTEVMGDSMAVKPI